MVTGTDKVGGNRLVPLCLPLLLLIRITDSAIWLRGSWQMAIGRKRLVVGG